MKITVLTSTNNYDSRRGYILKINGKTAFCAFDGEPEDNCIFRNFSDVYSLSNILELAYTAGKNGEQFEVEDKEVSWDEINE